MQQTAAMAAAAAGPLLCKVAEHPILCASLQAAERVRVLEQQAAALQQQQAAAVDQQARQRQQLAAGAQRCSQLEGELEAAGRLLQQAEQDGRLQAEEQVTVPCLVGRLLQHTDQDNRLQADEWVSVSVLPDMKAAPTGKLVQLFSICAGRHSWPNLSS